MGPMSDSFIPEADALDQRREVAADPLGSDDEREPAIEYPRRMPLEASESDVLEQAQEVDLDDEDEGR
jgi:hypothetical protein